MQCTPEPKLVAIDGNTLHWDDLVVGDVIPFGHKTVVEDEVLAFARAFDPQAHHLDEAAAGQSLLGSLSASGWHSCCMLMRMLVYEVLARSTSLGSPGIEEVKWLKPVRPGDELTCRYTVLEKRPLNSRPTVGYARVMFEMLNQNTEVVLTLDCGQFFGRRIPEQQA